MPELSPQLGDLAARLRRAASMNAALRSLLDAPACQRFARAFRPVRRIVFDFAVRLTGA